MPHTCAKIGCKCKTALLFCAPWRRRRGRVTEEGKTERKELEEGKKERKKGRRKEIMKKIIIKKRKKQRNVG